jgi:hypothetical protein
MRKMYSVPYGPTSVPKSLGIESTSVAQTFLNNTDFDYKIIYDLICQETQVCLYQIYGFEFICTV